MRPSITIPPEPDDLPFRHWIAELEHHATALGYFCMEFASFESEVDYVIQALLQCTDEELRVLAQGSGQIGNRCDLALKLAYAAPMPEGDTHWRDEIEAQINFARETLLPLRNRFIHDQWLVAPGPYQWDRRVALQSPQSRQPKALSKHKRVDRPLRDIWMATKQTRDTYLTLFMVRRPYEHWRKTGLIEDMSPQLVQSNTDQPDLPLDKGEDIEPPPQSSEASPRKKAKKVPKG